ncbi:hypothetical protein A2X44_02895 [candidate division CPR3 bacterium GWF2_35_18]|uniref:Membrane protein n=1 Tax=candidate division CPR3 bacterium GW2011_GWF2_35_18 TaxID=1618350 RepID=A0A0G0EQ42_UNCC3|nr:MAG: Membrane protein [candidate division CPR3 bacterium GW2011_GWF2_35_18]KKP86787.1 MAG: Membrane protein [candidate division CPR3 bacterium GW2011_GWE2_35_7]OGB62931.1 MAG: hypothetical protein A2X44_02895 [candidate division CPR3 bacterium GWF2_35_18]OGB65943.1 MAG: hypothetical protein A2250_03495 [candidate division CPR3 bacterium RIFOXYA2_FULL_35_13]OGB80512.1 MAG: hypothetical protein A2011_00360 [candidate division CPR3 bacterium GWE2_35_7]
MIEPLYGLSSKEIVTSAERAQRIETVLKSQLTKQTNEFVDPAPVVKEGSEADFLIVYGQGPVLPGNLREHDDTQGDVNVYCRLNAVAAAAMYREGLTTKVILTGGRTGRQELKSEGELMKNIMVHEYGIPEEAILVEDKAGNTLQNYANSLEMEGGIKEGSRIMHLAAPHHTGRVHMMAKMYDLDGPTFSSEQVLRQVFDTAIRGEDYDTNFIGFDSNTARKITQNMHILFNADDNPNFFARATAENRWTEGLIQMPEYWIMQAAMINDEKRFIRILQTLKDIKMVLPECQHPLGKDLNYQENVIGPFLQRCGIDLSAIDFNNPEAIHVLMQRMRDVKRDLSPQVWDSIYGSEYANYENPEEWLPRIIADIDLVIAGIEGKAKGIHRPNFLRELLVPAENWLSERGIELPDEDNINKIDELLILKRSIQEKISN